MNFLKRFLAAMSRQISVILALASYENNRQSANSSAGSWEGLVNPLQIMLFFIGIRIGFRFLMSGGSSLAGSATNIYFNIVIFMAAGFMANALFTVMGSGLAYVVVQQGASSRPLPPGDTDVSPQHLPIGSDQHGSRGCHGLKPGVLGRENIEDERPGIAENFEMTDVLARVEPIDIGEAVFGQGDGQQFELRALHLTGEAVERRDFFLTAMAARPPELDQRHLAPVGGEEGFTAVTVVERQRLHQHALEPNAVRRHQPRRRGQVVTPGRKPARSWRLRLCPSRIQRRKAAQSDAQTRCPYMSKEVAAVQRSAIAVGHADLSKP